jgi:hypothetical protein
MGTRGKHSIDKTQMKKDKLTDAEKKKIKQAHKASANPEKAAANKEASDRCRANRIANGTKKVIK